VSSIAATFPDNGYYPYGRSKMRAERQVATSGLSWTIVRPTLVIGRRSGVWRGLSMLARSHVLILPGDGTSRAQPIYIDDLVGCLLEVVYGAARSGDVLEFGGPERMSFDDFLKEIYRAIHGREARATVRLPLRSLIKVLTLLERPLLPLLPLTAGQLSAFCNDAIAEPNPLFERFVSQMKGIRAMVAAASGS
jgi:NADH dehydrogenase